MNVASLTRGHTRRDMANGVVVADVSRAFGDTAVLRSVSLDIAPGEFLAILGPSGCGKTTLLRIVAGLLQPGTGKVSIAGDVVADAAAQKFVPAEKRHLGMVFQDYALWPHLRVRENVSFPLESRRVPAAERQDLVTSALTRVGLQALAERFPAELSGGQQQRVALARAIAGSPRILLFDEPLSNLDTALRETLGREIAALTRDLGLTAIYVTHDQMEALSLADRVAVMRDGRVVQVDEPQNLYNAPADTWVAEFLRVGSLVPGVLSGNAFTPTGSETGFSLPTSNGVSGAAKLLIPSGGVRLGNADGDAHLIVTASHFKGERYEIIARWPGRNAPSIQFWHEQPFEPESRVSIAFERARLRLYPDSRTP